MSFFPMPRVNAAMATLATAVALVLAACTGAGSDGGNDDPEGDTDSESVAQVSNLAAASSDFVSAAVEGQRADSFFATDARAEIDPRAIPNVETLTERLTDLEAFRGTVTEVRLSTDAYPGSGDDLAPACDESAGVFCQVDLVSGSGSIIASVVVFWFGDGVTDYSIITRSSEGVANGVGEARCDTGYQLLRGGHTDRFDVAICVSDSGLLHYEGAERGEDRGIRLDACQDGPDRWLADNSGFEYSIDGTGSESASTLEVKDPSGAVIEDGGFTTVHLDSPVTPVFC